MFALRKLFTNKKQPQTNSPFSPEHFWGPLFPVVAGIINNQVLDLTNFTLEDVTARYQVKDSYDVVIHDWHFGRYPLADDDDGVPHAVYERVNHILSPHNGDSMCVVMLAAVLDSATALDSLLGRFPSVNIMSVCSSSGATMLEVAGPRVTALLVSRLPLAFKELCPSHSLKELTASEIFHVLTLRHLATLTLFLDPLLDIIGGYLCTRVGTTENEVWTLRMDDDSYVFSLPGRECLLSRGICRNQWSFLTVVYKEAKRFELVFQSEFLMDDRKVVDASLWEIEDVDSKELRGPAEHLRVVRLKNCASGCYLTSDNNDPTALGFEPLSQLSRRSVLLLCSHFKRR